MFVLSRWAAMHPTDEWVKMSNKDKCNSTIGFNLTKISMVSKALSDARTQQELIMPMVENARAMMNNCVVFAKALQDFEIIAADCSKRIARLECKIAKLKNRIARLEKLRENSQ